MRLTAIPAPICFLCSINPAERAREKGVRLGRKPISNAMKTEIIAMRATGTSMAKIANELGISAGIVCKVVNT